MDFPQAYTEPVRWAMVASLGYATYLVIMCPCPTPVGCSQGQFYGAVLLPVVATSLLNAKSNA